MQHIQNTQTKPDARPFNLYLSGYGFLNRARMVKAKNGNDFLAVNVTALEGVFDGDWNEVGKTRFDTIAVTSKAKSIIAEHLDRINDPDCTVMAAFGLSGCRPQIFTYEESGEPGIRLKSRLLKISWLKIGDRVIDLQPFEAREESAGDESANETEASPPRVRQSQRNGRRQSSVSAGN